jgi:hypothetical protein
MDLRAYYKKVREIESELPSSFVVTVSLETPDGGKPGVFTEVAKLTAAKHIAEGRARVATADEADEYHLRNLEARQAFDDAAAINRMQFMVIPAKSGSKKDKE